MSVGLAGIIVSPACYLLYFPLDRNALLGEARRPSDGIVGELGEFNEIGLDSEEVVIVLLWSEYLYKAVFHILGPLLA